MAFTPLTMPEEFYTVTSAKMLVAPQPQFIHAAMAKLALATELSVPDTLGVTLERSLMGNGASVGDVQAGRLQLAENIMGNAMVAAAELGKTPGDTIRFNRPSFTASTYTEASRQIAAGATISTTPIDIASSQAAITLYKYGGPYSTAVQPYAIDALAAKLSVHKTVELFGQHLIYDFDRWLDTVVVGLHDAVQTANILYPTGFAANNDFLVAGDGPMDLDLILRAQETLDAGNVPTFADGFRVCLLHPRQVRQLQSDSSYATYASYHKEANPLFPGYIGTVGKVHVLQSTNLTTTTNATPVSLYYGQMFGPGMAGIGAGSTPEVITASDDNYKQTVKFIWLWLAGFQTFDSSFGVSLRTD